FAGLRVLVEHRLAGDWILVVEPAANGGARVTVGYRSVAGRVGVDAEGHRATAERRRPEAIGGGVGAEGAAVVGGVGPGTRGDGLVAVHHGLVLAACLEVAVGVLRDLRHLVELGQVHRIGVLGAGRHVGDLAVADRHAVVAGRHRVGAQRDAVGAGGDRTTADRHALAAGRPGVATQRGAARAARVGKVAYRRRVEGTRVGEATHGGGIPAVSRSRHAHRRRGVTGGTAVGAHRDAA